MREAQWIRKIFAIKIESTKETRSDKFYFREKNLCVLSFSVMLRVFLFLAYSHWVRIQLHIIFTDVKEFFIYSRSCLTLNEYHESKLCLFSFLKRFFSSFDATQHSLASSFIVSFTKVKKSEFMIMKKMRKTWHASLEGKLMEAYQLSWPCSRTNDKVVIKYAEDELGTIKN